MIQSWIISLRIRQVESQSRRFRDAIFPKTAPSYGRRSPRVSAPIHPAARRYRPLHSFHSMIAIEDTVSSSLAHQYPCARVRAVSDGSQRGANAAFHPKSGFRFGGTLIALITGDRSLAILVRLRYGVNAVIAFGGTVGE